MEDEESTSSSADSPIVVPAGDLIEPSMALALNVHASPGVYALLLGSGISIASGVKTGWGVVEDLVGKVAAVRDPDKPDVRVEAMADPQKWWESNCDEALGYSGLLAAVAPKPASRQALLAEYFEPEDGDDDGGKAPTAAHRAIAQLVKRGSIRVILTTNFDRLMERALQEVGISPQVVHRPEAIEAMMPLAHSQVTVIKLHGDYADLDQRNTVDELGSYPEAQQGFLERVLVVLTRRVVDTTDWWLTIECGVAPVVVVGVEEVLQGLGAFVVAGVRAHIRPLVQQSAIQTLDLAVRLRAIGASAFVGNTGGGERLGEQLRSVAGAVVGENALDGDAVCGEEGVRARPEGGRGLLAFVG